MHEIVLQVVALVVVVAVVRAIARRTGLEDSLLLLLVGGGLSFVPGVPSYQVDADLVLVVILPLLLYAAAFTASLPGFRENLRSIGMLSLGLTLFTTLAVGFVLHLVVPEMPLWVALVLGAIVAPSDAVAAIALGRKSGMPSRVVHILEGESLFNDAAALTVYQVTVAVVVSGTFGAREAAGQFALAVVGGLVVGAVAARALGWIRRRMRDPSSDTALSLVAPFVAYLGAEAVHGSGLVAVVVTGLYLGHHAPGLMDASSRLIARSVWQNLEYLLSGAVFLLIGLQFAEVVARLSDPPGVVAVAAVAVIVTMLLARVAWMFPGAYLPRLLSRRMREKEGDLPWQEPAVAAWAGLRGVVSLGAAYALPATLADGTPFPYRDLLIFLTVVAIAFSLIGQGLTLPAVVRRLRTRPEPEPHVGVVSALRAAADAELAHLDELLEEEEYDDELVTRLRDSAGWRRLAAEAADPGGDAHVESHAAVYQRLRGQMLDAGRRRLVQLRDEREIDEGTFVQVQRELDIEEMNLRRT